MLSQYELVETGITVEIPACQITGLPMYQQFLRYISHNSQRNELIVEITQKQGFENTAVVSDLIDHDITLKKINPAIQVFRSKKLDVIKYPKILFAGGPPKKKLGKKLALNKLVVILCDDNMHIKTLMLKNLEGVSDVEKK